VIVFLLLVIVLLIGLTTAAVMGKMGGFMADPTSSQAFAGVPDGTPSAGDLAHLQFDQALRGYRMNQVDEVIDALGGRLRELETEIATLSAAHDPTPAPGASPPAADDSVPAAGDSSGVIGHAEGQ
jgi:DivIVA domain-containing protein